MSINGQAVRTIDVLSRLESCIHEIRSTGDLSEWISPDGLVLLNDNLMHVRQRRPVLERLINTPAQDLPADFAEQDLETETRSFEYLFFHLKGTLQIARGHQNSLRTPDPAQSIEAR
ncbi:hypothetical protein [Deinococcus altitudinis]|uniref:hypothetical protein n=1 Tax=Deinococcus altitudinis TaxID=468914 RepID=UPI003891A06A